MYLERTHGSTLLTLRRKNLRVSRRLIPVSVCTGYPITLTFIITNNLKLIPEFVLHFRQWARIGTQVREFIDYKCRSLRFVVQRRLQLLNTWWSC
jgi:hypothetical protein